jgi:hypothetical protein
MASAHWAARRAPGNAINETVALHLDLEASPLAHLATNDRVVRAQQLEPTHIPEARIELG